MRWNILFGIFIGFTLVFLVQGLWKNEFDWSWWIAMLIGGTIGYLLIAYLVPGFPKKKDH